MCTFACALPRQCVVPFRTSFALHFLSPHAVRARETEASNPFHRPAACATPPKRGKTASQSAAWKVPSKVAMRKTNTQRLQTHHTLPREDETLQVSGRVIVKHIAASSAGTSETAPTTGGDSKGSQIRLHIMHCLQDLPKVALKTNTSFSASQDASLNHPWSM